MDLSSRSAQPANSGQPLGGGPVARHKEKSASEKREMWTRIGQLAAFVVVAILLLSLIFFVSANNSNLKDNEGTYIKTNKLQAVFLNTGQVYFGNITTLNNNYVALSNIFYLQTSGGGSGSSSSNTNVTLVKLGCELHMPYDQMIINRSQVTFWENLEPNGQVAKAVANWDSQHPNGQQCSDQSSSASTSSGNSAQNAGSTAKP